MSACEALVGLAWGVAVVAAILLLGEQLFWLGVAAGALLLLRWLRLLWPTLDDLREALGL